MNPPSFESEIENAIQLHQEGKLDEAKAAYQSILKQSPRHPEASHLFGLVLHQQGDNEAAVPLIQVAADADPNNAGYLYNLGVVLQKLDRIPEAEACYRRVIALNPGSLSAWVNLGNLLGDAGHPGEAADCHRNALRMEPGNAEHHHRLGRSLRLIGDIENALGHLGMAAHLAPDDQTINSELLFTSQYEPGIHLAELSRRHFEWASRIDQAPLAKEISPNLTGVLRVGFLSPDMGNHPVGIFLAPLLEQLKDSPEIETICFNDRSKNDEFTHRNCENANHWEDVPDLSDDELFTLIKESNLDVLIELTGHTENNRLSVLARGPARIQMTWAGYVGSTGLEAIDYLVTDHFHSPDGFEAFASETLLRFPGDYIPYEPPPYAPDVAPLPMLENGYPTFGCLNNPSKLTTPTIQLWSEILRSIPNSRLILKYKGMTDPAVRYRILGLFMVSGVSADRIELIGQTQHGDHLSTFSRIDIAFDPMPYSGGLSTCEAIWMGVPVITAPGDTFASRHSLSHLSNAGLTEFIAGNREDYIQKARHYATHPDEMAKIRASMRDTVEKSSLCDLEAYAGDFLSAMKVVTETNW